MISNVTKEELRLEIRKKINKLARKADAKKKQLALLKQIEELTEFKKAKTILTYYPLDHEFDLSSLILSYPDKHWVLPRPIGKGIMLLFEVNNLAENLKPGLYGLKVPAGNSPLIQANELDLVIIPALAFDKQGFRLGQGMGYYDRLLSKLNASCITVGVAFKEQILDYIPIQVHDKAITKVLTV